MTASDSPSTGLQDAQLQAAQLQAALVRIAATEHLLVALDFDGTMAPLVARAQDARALPANATAFSALAELPHTSTALISGRALGSLREVSTPPATTLLVGSHGAETYLGPGSAPLELNESQKAALNEATRTLEKLTQDFPGTLVEYKPAGVVLHYRQAEPAVGVAAAAQARAKLNAIDGVFLGEGKMVLEVAVVQANKGQSIQSLRALTGATAVLFAGDDVTDEHALKVLGPADVGIKVGPGESAAKYRINSPESLAPVLAELAQARAAPPSFHL